MKKSLRATEVEIFDNDQEALCVQIKLENNRSMYLVLFYIVPDSPNVIYENFYEKIEKNIANKNNSEMIVLGDLNMPGYVNELSCNGVVNSFRAFLAFNNLGQYNQIRNANNVILDVVVASFESISVDNAKEILLPMDGHHPCLSVSLLTQTALKQCKLLPTTKFNFKKANFLLMYNLFKSQNWQFLADFSDVNLALEGFYNVINIIFEKSVPRSTQKSKRYPVWFTREIISLIKQKHKYFLRLTRYRSQFWKIRFGNIRSLLKAKIKEAHTTYLTDVEKSLKSNPRNFWAFVNSLKDSPDVLEEMTLGNGIYHGAHEVANGFADYFKSVYIDSADSRPNYSIGKLKSYFCNKVISSSDIDLAVGRLKGNKSIGPDGVPSYIYKGCCESLNYPLQLLFNLILGTSEFPDRWKCSKVIPVHKGGSRQDIKNYRPITIVCAVSKIFEMIIFDMLFTEVKGRIALNQHGFLPRRSTFTNLATFSQFVHEALNRKSQVDVVYTDLEKAFDKVEHGMILNSLGDMDVPQLLIDLIYSYLGTDRSKRYQYVEVKGCKSVVYTSTSGIPQGSNLGPLLFLIAFNNILSRVKNVESLGFADDFKLFFEVSSVAECTVLQRELSGVAAFCSESSFSLNLDKCVCMSFTRNRNTIVYDYSVGNERLKRVSEHKDLGVVFDPALSFSGHILSKISSAQKVSGFIARNTKCFNVDISLSLFDSLVLPILEYGSIIWSPQYHNWVEVVESVQRKFLKGMYYRRFGVYPQRGCSNDYLLGVFGRLSLKKRRIKVFLCTMYKILSNDIDCPGILEQLPFSVNRINSRNRNIFYLAYPRTNLYKCSPVYSLCDLFNLYASDVDNMDSISLKAFKKIIDGKLYLS